MTLLTQLAALFLACGTALASPVGDRSASDPVRTVFEFPNDTYVENLAVRSNGEVLLSPLTEPSLFVVDPQQRPAKAVPVYTFPEALGLAGITEYEPDVFAVITGNFSITTGDTGMGSWTVWSVNLGGAALKPDGTGLTAAPEVRKIATVPSAGFLNGVTVLTPGERGTLLISDVHLGTIVRMDIATGANEVVINNTYTGAVPAPPFPVAGVDGVHVRGPYLYFTNIGTSAFYRVLVDAATGEPAGPFEAIAHTPAAPDQYDDFTFDCAGNAYLVTGAGNSVEMISPTGRRQVIVAGNLNSTAIAEPTSAAFGRGLFDKNVLYVTTAGGLATPVDGDIVIGGQLVAVTTTSIGSC